MANEVRTCQGCGTTIHRPEGCRKFTKKFCAACIRKRRTARQVADQHARKAAGRCRSCGASVPDGHVFCIKHRTRANFREQLRQGDEADLVKVIPLWLWERWHYEDLWQVETPLHLLGPEHFWMRMEAGAL